MEMVFGDIGVQMTRADEASHVSQLEAPVGRRRDLFIKKQYVEV